MHNDPLAIEQIIAADLRSTHLESRPHESAIDRIGAFSKGNKLATLLWRWKYANDKNCAQPALNLLVRIAAEDFKLTGADPEYETLRRACKQALREWLDPQCIKCGGTGEVVLDARTLQCDTCDGMSVRRYSDGARQSALRVSDTEFPLWQKRLGKIAAVITGRCATLRKQIAQEREKTLH